MFHRYYNNEDKYIQHNVYKHFIYVNVQNKFVQTEIDIFCAIIINFD